MIYITAAYGPKHAGYLAGLARTWPRWNRAPLVVFTDQPVTAGDGLIVDRSISRAELDDSLPGRHFYTKKVVLAHAAAKRWTDDVCWIDADSLVFADLSQMLVPGKVNAVSYGKAGELRPVGEGVAIPQAEFLLNGLVSAPPEILREWEEAVRAMPAAGMEGCPEMEAWNRIALAHPAGVEVLDRSHSGLVWNLPHEHPTPENGAWTSAVGLDGEILTLGERKFAVLQWVSYALGRHLEREFYDIPHDGARRLLKDLYRVPGLAAEASLTGPFNQKVHERRTATPWARMDLASFARDMALQCASSCKDRTAGAHGFALEAAARPHLESGVGFAISWCGKDGRRLRVEAQELDLALWKAAELDAGPP